MIKLKKQIGIILTAALMLLILSPKMIAFAFAGDANYPSPNAFVGKKYSVSSVESNPTQLSYGSTLPSEWTDNDSETNSIFSTPLNHMYIDFTKDMNFRKLRFLSDNNADIVFFNSSGQVLTVQNVTANKSTYFNISVDNVRYVDVYGKGRIYDMFLDDASSSDTPPLVPKGLTATPGDGQVQLNWTANTEPDLKGYNLYRDGVKVNGTPLIGTNYTDTGRTNGTTYSYQISAVNTSDSESAKSAAKTATPLNTTPPAVPNGLTAIPGDGQITLNWTANTGQIKGYNLYRDGTKINGTPITETSYTDTGRTNGTTYSYQISAVSAADIESAKSAAITATPLDLTPPAVPKGLTATVGVGKVSLTWLANTEPNVSYNLYRDGTKINGTPISGTSYVDTGRTIGTYNYQISAINTLDIESGKSAAKVVTVVKGDDAAPSNLKAYSSDAKVSLSWSAVPSATKYVIYRDGQPIADVETGETYVDRDVENGKSYTYTVTAVSSDGEESKPSDPATASPDKGKVDFTDQVALPFTVGGMLATAISFLKQNVNWIIIVLAVLFAPVLIGLAIGLTDRARGNKKVVSVDGKVYTRRELEAADRAFREKYGNKYDKPGKQTAKVGKAAKPIKATKAETISAKPAKVAKEAKPARQSREGLIKQQIPAERNGKKYLTTVYVKPENYKQGKLIDLRSKR